LFEIPKCFETIKKIDPNSIIDLTLQYFKGNLKMPYSDIKALKAIMGLNDWHDIDFNVSEEYFDSVAPEPIACTILRNAYSNTGIHYYCMACSSSDDYMNKNKSEEEAILSYLVHNPDMLETFKEHGIDSSYFRSVVLCDNEENPKAVPILAKLYELVQTHSISSVTDEELKATLHSIFSNEELAGKIAFDYFVSLREMNISTERFKDSLSNVCGNDIATAIIPVNQILEDMAPTGFLSVEHSDELEQYYVQNDPKSSEEQLLFFEKTPKKGKALEKMKKNPRNGGHHSVANKACIDMLSNQITIDYDKFDSVVEVNDIVAPAPNQNFDSNGPELTREDNLLEIEQAPSEEELNTVIATPFININTIDDYNKIQSSMLTAGILYIRYYKGTNQLLMLYKRNDDRKAYIINVGDDKIRQEIGLLFISPSIIKVIETLLPLGSIYNSDMLRFQNVFELKSAEYLLKNNYLFSNVLKKRVDAYTIDCFDRDKREENAKYLCNMISKYEKFSKGLEEKNLTALYKNHVKMVQFVSLSIGVITGSEATRNVITGKLVTDKNIEIKDNLSGGLILKEDINKLAWITENCLMAILNSKLACMTDIRLCTLNNSSIVVDVNDKYMPVAFDVINQHMIQTFKKLVNDDICPTVLMNIKYKSA